MAFVREDAWFLGVDDVGSEDINGLRSSLRRYNPLDYVHSKNERNGYHFCSAAVDINALFPGRRGGDGF